MKKVATDIPGQDLHALVWKEDDLFVAECVEIVVASQGASVKEALKNLGEAIDLLLDEGGMKLHIPKTSARKDLQLHSLSYA